MDFIKIFLPAYVIVFVGLVFGWSSYRVWKRTGVNPYKFGRTDSAHDHIGRVYKFILLALAVAVGLRLLSPQGYRYLAPLVWLEHPYIQLIAVILLVAALMIIVTAQYHMSTSWRIGIDTTEKTPLIRRGLFSISRNPIFVGMRMTLLGLFLALPNAVTLAAFFTGDVLMQIQVRLEEEFLAGAHGAHYVKYREDVRRWV